MPVFFRCLASAVCIPPVFGKKYVLLLTFVKSNNSGLVTVKEGLENTGRTHLPKRILMTRNKKAITNLMFLRLFNYLQPSPPCGGMFDGHQAAPNRFHDR
jgi:hypothetical protein